jgi:hypothetical protein
MPSFASVSNASDEKASVPMNGLVVKPVPHKSATPDKRESG